MTIIGSPLLNSLLIWLHIFSAVGWLGTAMFMTILMSPILPALTPSTRSEIVLRLFPRLIRYIRTFAALTLVFGLALWYSVENGMPAVRGDAFGAKIAVGAALAVLAYIIVETRVIVTQRRILLVLQRPPGESEQASQDLPTLQRRLRASATSVLILLSIVLVFMVVAHFYGGTQIIPGAGV